MTWDVVHKFPVEKDTYQVPINYPDTGYDTIIALWFTDVFTSILAIEDALGYDIRDGFADLATRLSGRIFHTRIVGNTPDFDGSDFDDDGDAHLLDLSGIIPVGTTAVLLNGSFYADETSLPGLCGFYPGQSVGFWSFGDGVELTFSGDSASPYYVGFNVIIPVDGDRDIQYILDATIMHDESRLSVTGWFK